MDIVLAILGIIIATPIAIAALGLSAALIVGTIRGLKNPKK